MVLSSAEYKKASYTYSGMSVISPNLFRDMKDKIFPLEPILFEKASQGKLSGELTKVCGLMLEQKKDY